MVEKGQGWLLDRELPEGYLEEWAQRLRKAKDEYASGLTSVIVFRINQEYLALPAGLFIEVTRELIPHRVPHRDVRMLRGVVNVRGELLPFVDLASLLGLSADSQGRNGGVFSRRMPVVEKDGRWVFEVSEMLGGHRYDPQKLTEVPATVSKSMRKYTLGVFEMGDHNVGLLDHELVFYTLKAGLA
ncbi:MAG: chemotaxis protein CheW [Nitrospira sp.]|nr:chemotaxis protein CheW [Nitrospira sp.]